MCKSKKNKKEGEAKHIEGNENNSVKGAFVTISIVFSLTMAFLVIWPLKNKSYNVREVNIELNIPTVE